MPLSKLKAGTNELCSCCEQLKKDRDAAYGEMTRLYDTILLAAEATNNGVATLPTMVIELNYMLKESIRRHIEDWFGGEGR